MSELEQLGALFRGLRAVVTVADEDGRIVFLNDLAAEHYGDRGGRDLVGTHLNDCHNPRSQAKIEEIYARHRAGDMDPTRYHERKENGPDESILLVPIVIEDVFRGVAELMWDERDDLVLET